MSDSEDSIVNNFGPDMHDLLSKPPEVSKLSWGERFNLIAFNLSFKPKWVYVGRGGSGVVKKFIQPCRCHHEYNCENALVRYCKKEIQTNQDKYILNEIGTLKLVTDHPNFVKILGDIKVGNTWEIYMEFCEMSLNDKLVDCKQKVVSIKYTYLLLHLIFIYLHRVQILMSYLCGKHFPRFLTH